MVAYIMIKHTINSCYNSHFYYFTSVINLLRICHLIVYIMIQTFTSLFLKCLLNVCLEKRGRDNFLKSIGLGIILQNITPLNPTLIDYTLYSNEIWLAFLVVFLLVILV